MQSYRVIHQHFHHSNLQVQVQPLPVTLDGHLSKTSRSSQRSFAKLHLKSLQKGMIWTTRLPRTLSDQYDYYGHLVLEICSASNSRIFAKIAQPPMNWSVGHKMSVLGWILTTLKPNGPVASINGWLQCPGGNFEHRSDMIRPCQAYSKHIQRTFKTPEPKTQFGKSPSKDGNLPNGFREVKGRESLTHFETPMASSEICYCYME